MPLDEDWLSVMDLFELMQSAQAALGKVGGSDEGDAESEARNLLRGILHGADVLWKYVDEQEVSGTEANGKPAASADEDKPSPLGEEKKAALGLARPHADSELAFLQGFALHELASLLEPVEHKAVSAVASGSSSSSSSKKRKVDPREPTDPAEWLDRAASKFDYAVRPPTSSGSGAELWSVMTAAYAQRCRADRGLLALARGDSDTANAIVSKSPPKAFAEQLALALPSSDSLDTLETMTAEVGDPLKAVVEALASSISLVEAAEHLDVAERMQLLDRLASDTSDALSQSESLFGEAVAGSRPAQADQWIFEFCSVLADARLAKFVLHEETIEAKFRPEEENDDGDDEVKPLPTSNDQVQAARADGEESELASGCRSWAPGRLTSARPS